MKKKYTMEEFKKMFEEAEAKVIEEFDEHLEEVQKKKGMEKGLPGFAMQLQNMMIIAMLEHHLFEKEK